MKIAKWTDFLFINFSSFFYIANVIEYFLENLQRKECLIIIL